MTRQYLLGITEDRCKFCCFWSRMQPCKPAQRLIWPCMLSLDQLPYIATKGRAGKGKGFFTLHSLSLQLCF